MTTKDRLVLTLLVLSIVAATVITGLIFGKEVGLVVLGYLIIGVCFDILSGVDQHDTVNCCPNPFNILAWPAILIRWLF